MEIKARIGEIQDRIAMAARRAGRAPEAVTLLAVTKTFPVGKIREAYDAGLRLFGENRVRETLEKQNQLPTDIHWHLIGRLQTNKINKALGRFQLIESVDSVKLARGLSERLEADQEILLEVNCSGEAAKSGFAPEGFLDLFPEIETLPHIRIRGLMTVGPLGADSQTQRRSFRLLGDLFEKARGRAVRPELLTVLSMGMSGDFETAIEEGATQVRVGSALFGERT